LFFRKPAPVDLISVRRKKEPIHQYNYTTRKRRVNLVMDELRPGGHEEKGFRRRCDVLGRIEKQGANRIAEGGTSWFSESKHVQTLGAQAVCKQTQLRRLPSALRPLENDEPAGGHQGIRRV
jgi:hypothetical protein